MNVPDGDGDGGCGWQQPPRVIVWDIDDTLVLESSFVRSGFLAVEQWLAREHGVQGFFAKAWHAFERGVRGTIFNEALRASSLRVTQELIGELVGVYREHRPQIALLGDACAAIEGARAAGIAMAVITDGPVVMQGNKVRALGLDGVASPCVLAWSEGKALGKPHPSSFERVQQVHGVGGEELVYIADNPVKDFVAPRALGWRTIRVRRRGGLHHEVDSGDDVDVELRDLSDVLARLGVYRTAS